MPIPAAAAGVLGVAKVLGEGAAGSLLADTMEVVWRRIKPKAWEDAAPLTRLFWMLEGTYSDRFEGFKVRELARTWGRDKAFLDVYQRLVDQVDPEGEYDKLVGAIEPLVKPTATMAQRQVAAEVASYLPWLVPESLKTAELILYEQRENRRYMEGEFEDLKARVDALLARPTVRLLLDTSDWPDAARDAAKRAVAADPDGFANLYAALDGKDQEQELQLLLRRPREWMSSLGAGSWALIATLCEEYGLWEEAERSWVAARERPGADFAGCSARAAEAAAAYGNQQRARVLLDEARG
jgi:hypothetical protein